MVLSAAVRVFIEILKLLILVRILTSWFRPRYRTSSNSWFFAIDEMVWRATEPLLAPIRNILPPMSGFDFSALILLLLIQFLGGMLVNALYRAGL